MAGKHSLATSSRSPSKRKKPLHLQDQSRLDSFLSRPGASSPSVSTSREIIDVDLLDDEYLTQVGSSSDANTIEKKSQETKAIKPFFKLNAIQPVDQVPVYDSLALASDPVTFTPESFTGIKPFQPIPYSFLATTLLLVSETRSRITIINTLTNALRVIIANHTDSLLPAIYLLSNNLAPPYSAIELGIGHSTISQSIQHVSGLTTTAMKQLYHLTGDPGDVAFAAKSKLRTLFPHPPLLITTVYDAFLSISRCKGQGAAKQKQSIVERILVSAKGEEIRFLVRTMCQNLRVGAVRTSILTALAKAVVLTPPCHDSSPLYASSKLVKNVGKSLKSLEKDNEPREAINRLYNTVEKMLRQVYVRHPNYDHIVIALREVGLSGLEDHVPLSLGIPVYPTLGSPIRTFEEIYEHLGQLEFSAEFKYDGQRAQIHGWKDTDNDGHISIKIFSRHLEQMTDKYPDVVQLFVEVLQKSTNVKSFILDSEIVALDSDGSIQSFQELSGRARKDVQLDDIMIPVGVFAFDLMMFNNESLLEMPFRARRENLCDHFLPYIPENPKISRLYSVARCDSTKGREAIEEFWEQAVEGRSEGLMIKLLDCDISSTGSSPHKLRKKPLSSTYDADKRTFSWMKLKKDYVDGLGDSLDLIPIGAWYGNGRKAQWWSPILLGVWDSTCGKPIAICKCMSGFNDAFYKTLNERYPLSENSETCSKRSLWECEFGGLKPDVYFKPQEVWEVKGAEITLSPVSVAGKGLIIPTRGLSVRFPRFLRVREEMGIENSTRPQFIADIWRKQSGSADEIASECIGDSDSDRDLRSGDNDEDGVA